MGRTERLKCPSGAPEVPDRAPEVPDRAPKVPDRAPKVPEGAPQVPFRSPDSAGQSPESASLRPASAVLNPTRAELRPMRVLLLAALVSLPALADVGPRPPRCEAPTTCVACVVPDTADSGCVANASDAGLVLADCSDRVSQYTTTYYCPPGTPVGRGCNAAPGGVMALLGVLMALRRRRASRRTALSPTLSPAGEREFR